MNKAQLEREMRRRLWLQTKEDVIFEVLDVLIGGIIKYTVIALIFWGIYKLVVRR